MDNEAFKPEKTEEEYHFSETENASVYTTEDVADKKNILERIQRKNIIIAVVVMVVIFGLYKIVGGLLTPSAKSTKPVAVAPPKPTIAPAVVAEQAVEKAVIATLSEKLNAVEAQNQANTDKLSAQIAELQNTLSGFDSRFNSLNTTVQDLVTKQQEAEAKKAAKKTRAKRAYVTPRPIYFVRALVPGRAWLETKSGKTVTTSVGHNLPGYGTVIEINTDKGTVTTNTGAIIGYSPNDS